MKHTIGLHETGQNGMGSCRHGHGHGTPAVGKGNYKVLCYALSEQATTQSDSEGQ